MIPLEYRLRDPVRVEPGADGAWRVVCESPLTVLTVNSAAARLLRLARDGATVAHLAGECGTPRECVTPQECGLDEERVFAICERLRSRGILEVGRAPGDGGFEPAVSVIVPTRDRADDLDECLEALGRVDYPRDRLEVIVVDDGSTDGAAVAEVVARRGHRLISNDRNRGPAYSRNRAAREAAGEILAFIDSDCVAGPRWLRELTPYFLWDRVGAVGGRTVGYYTKSRLDRYEEVASPLDMGRYLMVEAKGPSTFYVPTCNLLVRRSAYGEAGGLREDLLVGEDVDFCWRLRAGGSYLVYSPEGVVRHKHRDRLGSMLRRRAQYGTSEAPLHALHPDKRKRFPLAPAPLTTVGLLSMALIAREPRLLPACLAPVMWEGGRRTLRLRRAGVDVPARSIWTSVLRGHLSMIYFVYFHLVRYYLGPLAAAGMLLPGVRLLTAVATLYAAGVGYATRRPRVSYPVYLAYYLAEHAAYQAGVIVGSVRTGTFRSYLPAVQPGRSPRPEAGD
ncbi:MAG: mycofactocin biosynthesis glycosyltransferase MftF [Thermoleophilia bacterium]|nr:mycofactocin biosynthesis glycosyltransferase MftF [Thermoleophilia bacterium]